MSIVRMPEAQPFLASANPPRCLFVTGPHHGLMTRIRKLKLGEPEPNDWAGTTLQERLMAVWQLTRTAYAFKGADPGDTRLPRHVARFIRRGG
jgi:hypothetical protein